MSVLALVELALTIWMNKTGSFLTYLGKTHVQVTVTQAADNTPVTHFTFEEALQLAMQVLGAQIGSFTFKLGANEYTVTIAAV